MAKKPKEKSTMSETIESMEKQAQESVDKKGAVAVAKCEVSEICGIKVRRMSLATMSLLMSTGNKLIEGLTEEDEWNPLLECGKFIVIHTDSIKNVRKICRDPERLEAEAYEILDRVPIDEMAGFRDGVINYIKSFTSKQVTPVADEEGAGKEEPKNA